MRHPPLFPPDQWSVFENNVLGFPRSQNNVEAWHHRWNTITGKNHIGLYKFKNQIKKEQHNIEIQFERINAGEARPNMRSKDIERENRLKTHLANRGNRTLLEFVKGIAHNLKSY